MLNKLPILILCYNKLDSLKTIISIIRKLKFTNIYISLDGPISSKDKDNLKVLNYINKIKKKNIYKIKINKHNKGCKIAVYDGISWFFKKEKKGVILEEDCIPSKSFFNFCHILLDRFKNNKKIGHISGTNPIEKYGLNESYFYSHYGGVWGWATWKNRWSKYDINMKGWKGYSKLKLYMKTKNLFDFLLRYNQFNNTFKNKIDTWDYQWTFAKIKNNYLSVIPNKNLITNVGFNKKAKHTLDKKNSFSRMRKYEISFPLKHNIKIKHSRDFYDRVVNKRIKNLIKII